MKWKSGGFAFLSTEETNQPVWPFLFVLGSPWSDSLSIRDSAKGKDCWTEVTMTKDACLGGGPPIILGKGYKGYKRL